MNPRPEVEDSYFRGFRKEPVPFAGGGQNRAKSTGSDSPAEFAITLPQSQLSPDRYISIAVLVAKISV